MAKIPVLIDKQDTFEMVRDQIGAILLTEKNNQVLLAIADGKDPALWEFEVYSERSDPFSILRDDTQGKSVCHVWFDRDSASKSAGNTYERQSFDGFFNIDVISSGVNIDKAAGGQVRADHDAFLNAQRITTLVRNILMFPEYRYLDLRGLVAERWVDERESYRVEPDKPQSSPNIAGIRIRFRVKFNEFAPQTELDTLDEINIKVFRQSDGKLILESEFE